MMVPLLLALALAPQRVQIDVAMVEDRAGRRTVLAETRIEGPAGTDFEVNLRGEQIRLRGSFVTDLVDGGLEVRADLDGKRRYGTSPRKLPIWEEDEQQRTLRVGFDESMVLLPFGGDALKIEISPTLLPPAQGPLRIQILKQSPEGALHVSARRIPHRFVCDARLLEGGREVARGSAGCVLGRPADVLLDGARPLVVALTVDSYQRDRPVDLVGIGFDVREGARAVAREWSGVGRLGEELDYPTPDGRELRIAVRLADGETAD